MSTESPTFAFDEALSGLDPHVHARRWFTLAR